MTSTQSEIVNKQSKSNILGKRKKVRERRRDYLHNWIEKSSQHTLSCIPDVDTFDMYSNPYTNNYLNSQNLYNSRLFNATSDPTVCRYSTPFNYPGESVSLPVYPSPYFPFQTFSNGDCGLQNTTKYNRQVVTTPNKGSKHANHRRKTRSAKNTNNEFKAVLSDETGTILNNLDIRSATPSVNGNNNEFASLPPVVNGVKENALTVNSAESEDKCENKRRFSDPGLPQNQTFVNPHEETPDESESESSSLDYDRQNNNKLLMCLIDHINLLKDCNRKLHKELGDTKGELESLKQQLSIWRGDSASSLGQTGANIPSSQTGPIGSAAMYSPGMLADLVREIRDAARVREEALYSKVRSIVDEKNYSNKNHATPPQSYEKIKLNERLGKLEEELHNLRINHRESVSPYPATSTSGYGSSPANNNDHVDRQRLVFELNKERAAHAAADARINKLEMLVTQLQSKRGGYTPMSTPIHANGTSTPDGRHVVMGPITDL